MPLVLLERSWWAGFNGIHLVRFGFRMWEIFIFNWFLLLKISKNQVLEGKISWERCNTCYLKAYHSIQAWFPFRFGCSKNPYIHCKTMFTCWVSLFCNGFTLGPTAQATLVHIMYPCWESALWWSLHVLFYLLLFFQTITPQKRIWKKIKTFEAKK